MKKIINEKKNRFQVFENKMRAWKYLDDINKACEFFIYNKENILKLDQWTQYSIGNDFVIKIASEPLFKATYPMQANAGGFMQNGQLILKMLPQYTVKTLKSTILHELEHAIDFRDNFHEIERAQQQVIQGIAYQSVYNPKKVDDPIEQELEIQVRYILYHYWVDTEKNAFVSASLSSLYSIEKQINNDFKRLKWIASTDADKYASFWFQMQTLLINRKRGVDTIYKVVPKNIKKHFIKQSYHKIKQYQNTVNKKLMYAKMNNLGVASTIMYNTQQLPPLPPTSPLQESKLHNIIVDVLKEMKAFHGGGASFKNFDSSYENTGEGSQSFGPGHYFTSSKRIGKDYATEHGTSIKPMAKFKFGCYTTVPDVLAMIRSQLCNYHKQYEDEYDKLYDIAKEMYDKSQSKEQLIKYIVNYAIKRWKEMDDEYNEYQDYYNSSIQRLYLRLKDEIKDNDRYLYQVEIPEENKYVDWNMTLPDEWIDTLANFLRDNIKDVDEYNKRIDKIVDFFEYYEDKRGKLTIECLYYALDNMNHDATLGRNIFKWVLKYYGYVGVKYPSGQNFQTSSTKDGDMNYTVFDDDNVKITNRWDI